MRVKPLNNFVLLKVKADNSKIKLQGGQILQLDTSYAVERHSNVVCEVVSVPDRLIFGYSTDIGDRTGKPLPKPHTMDWKCDMELRPGDEVIIHYMAYVNAFGDDKRAFILDDQEYFFCPYSMIYLAKRRWTKNEEDVFWKVNTTAPTKEQKEELSIVIDGEKIYNVIMLNGYVLCQPIEKALTSKYLELPDHLTKTNKKKIKVCYVGKPNQEYLNGVYYDIQVSPGDVIYVDKSIDVPLEADDHKSFNGDEPYWRLQSCLIYAVESKEDVQVQ